jgi:enterochelin esterase family protein
MKHERLPLKFYVNIGNLETNNLRALHNFRNMLQQKGYTYHYEEYPGGHEYIAWREQLSEGLIYLIGVNSNG